MSPYRNLSEMLYKNAIQEHRLEGWDANLSDEKKEEILLSLDRKLNHLICDNRKEMYEYVVTEIVSSAKPAEPSEEEKPSIKVKVFHDGDFEALTKEDCDGIEEELRGIFKSLFGGDFC